ncbi:acetylxylan esterase [Desulfoferula mesophila]|uniref:Acetylxylan esterase n=1 Tax=Desulfoferula mesophila TaxID=3058419 RepID=A0AAU9EHZ2_9BACT|nr:acetylxylan esterase [Desulfoferula mesophilus]
MGLLLLAGLLLLGGVGCGSDWDESGALVFLLAGQSNMSGHGDLSELPPGFPANAGRIGNFSNADVWTRAVEPLDDPAGQKDACSLDLCPGVGPGLAFAQVLTGLMPQARVGLIPCARGGSTLAHWAPGSRPDSLYGSSLRRARLAGAKARLAGVLFYQGESDAYSRQAAETWPSRFAALVAAWRRDLGDPRLPVVFCQIGALAPQWRADPAFRYWDLLKKRQAALRLPLVRMVTTDDLALKDDGIHLTTASQMILGRRLAQAMYELLEKRGTAGGKPARPRPLVTNSPQG